MRYTVRSALARGLPKEQIWVSLERNMQCAVGLCGHCQFGPAFICKDGPVFRYDRIAPFLDSGGTVMAQATPGRLQVRLVRRLPALAVWTARTSCWRWPEQVEIAYFLEATSRIEPGPYDVALVEGSITTPHDAERIRAGPPAIASF